MGRQNPLLVFISYALGAHQKVRLSEVGANLQFPLYECGAYF